MLPDLLEKYISRETQICSCQIILVLYSLHIYLELEFLLTLVKVLVFITLGCDLEPQADEPYLATSLQEFWGHRWNLMVPAILRPAVYTPVRRITEGKMKTDPTLFLGVFSAFLVSGVVHELIVFYTHEMPTGEVTWFFVLHGVCTATEKAMKRTVVLRWWSVSPMVSRLITVGFVVVTSGWLFFPPLIRSNIIERLANEAFCLLIYPSASFIYFGL